MWEDLGGGLSRRAVAGGWLYRIETNKGVSLTFVAEPTYQVALANAAVALVAALAAIEPADLSGVEEAIDELSGAVNSIELPGPADLAGVEEAIDDLGDTIAAIPAPPDAPDLAEIEAALASLSEAVQQSTAAISKIGAYQKWGLEAQYEGTVNV